MLFKIKSHLRAACFIALAQASLAVEKPNIIIFYVDDLGWQDVQLNDIDDPCTYETPNIIKLAASGMNITQGYSPAPTCSPSRAAIISGQHPAQTRLTHVDLAMENLGKPADRLSPPYLEGHLNTNIMTLADAMNANGYNTGHVGKWHAGLNAHSYGFDFVNQSRGIHRGMPDRTRGFATAGSKQYPLSKEKYFPQTKKAPNGISYPYDELTEAALTFMDESKDEPFFLNLCHWMVHWPMVTQNGELLEYYCDKFNQPFPPKKGDMKVAGQQNPYFASMVTTVDWSLGRVVSYLEKTDDPRNPGKKLIETTYIFFTSDNGGAEKKGGEILSDNAPLKYGKKNAEEGGVRVPTVVSGPSIKAGSQYHGLVNQLDYFPTILKLTGSTIDTESFNKLSGLDITPVLESKSEDIVDANGKKRDHLFWHYPHGDDQHMKSSIRSGDFKLYKRYGSNDYELYRLYKEGKRGDFEEMLNLAKDPEFSSVVERLGAILAADLAAVNAEGPYLNPRYKNKKLPSIDVASVVLKTEGQEVKASFSDAGPILKKAFVIYKYPPSDQTSKKHPKGKVSKLEEMMNMRHPAEIGEGGRSVSAQLPERVTAAVFMVIDENNYINYTDLVALAK